MALLSHDESVELERLCFGGIETNHHDTANYRLVPYDESQMVVVSYQSDGLIVELVPKHSPRVSKPEIVRSDECMECAKRIVDRLGIANQSITTDLFQVHRSQRQNPI